LTRWDKGARLPDKQEGQYRKSNRISPTLGGSQFTAAGTEGNIGHLIVTFSEAHMYARVWRAGILPGKVEEFAAAINSSRPILRGQPGFRGLLVLRSGPGALEATVVSLWASIDDLRNSEGTAFQQAAVSVLSYCEPHPVVREEEVVVSEFVSDNLDDDITKF
jgi:heme-degrading monooxygenase HmoA